MIKLKCFQNKNKTFLSNSLNLCALSTSCIPIRIISYCRIPLTRHYFPDEKLPPIPYIPIPFLQIYYTRRVPQKKLPQKKAARNEPPQIPKNVSILRAAYKTPKPPTP